MGRFWDGLIRPSTRAFFNEGRRAQGYSKWDWLHGYVYGRWTYLYIGIGTGEHRLARLARPLGRLIGKLWKPISDLSLKMHSGAQAKGSSQNEPERITFADTYHGKVVPLEAALQLVSVKEEISLPNLEKVIPYAKARDIIMKNPEHILALECPCRSGRENPCLPLDVCLIIGDPFASFVEEHHPKRARQITSQEAIEILRAEDERGHVHHAFFKDAMLGRFYAICNCCPCCCGAMHAHQHGTPMLASSGYLAQIDPDFCLACGTCLDGCPFGALTSSDEAILVDEERCMGCGICVGICPQQAIALQRASEKGEPLEIFELIQKALV